MRKKGFTLVELLAVIVILGIIIAIAVPNVITVISNSRLNSFNVSSEMLEKAARAYLITNNITVAVGTTIEISYSVMLSAGSITRIVDPISRNECTNSRVFVTNTAGNFTFRAGLVCDNFLDIDTYNLVVNGDFTLGTTGWTFHPGAALDPAAGINNGACGRVVFNGVVPSIVLQNINVVGGRRYYGYGWFRRVGNIGTAANHQFDIFAPGLEMDFAILNNNTLPLENNWYRLTNVIVAPLNALGEWRFFSHAVSATIFGDDLMLFDLTAIYGAGNEPTTAQMDNIMRNMGK